MVYVIAYDLVTPNDTSENYDKVITAIKNLGTWARLEQSVWLLNVDLDRAVLRNRIFASMHAKDRLFVGGLNGVWACSEAIPSDIKTWLSKQDFD